MSTAILNKTSIPFFEAQNVGDVLKSGSSSFFASFKFLTKERQNALSAVYAFFRIIDDCVDELPTSEAQIHALHFWESEICLAAKQQAKHPITREVGQVMQDYQIPLEHFLGLIEGCRWDADGKTYQTWDDTLSYCYRVAGLVGLVCMKIFGHESATSHQAALDFGYAFQLTNILRDVGEDALRGRCYLPKDELSKHHLTAQDISNPQKKQAFEPVLQEFAKRAKHHYTLARAEFKNDLGKNLLATKAMANVYEAILNKIVSSGVLIVLNKRVSLNVFQKIKAIVPVYFEALT